MSERTLQASTLAVYGEGPAVTRTARAVLIVSALTQLLYVVINLGAVTTQFAALRTPYAIILAFAGVLAVLVPPVLSLLARHRVVALYVQATALVALALAAIWPVMLRPESAPVGYAPWPHLFVPFSMMTAATAFAPVPLAAYGAAVGTVSLPLLISAFGGFDELVAVHWIGAYGPPVVFGGLVVGVMRYAFRLDDALEQSRQALVDLARQDARARTSSAVNAVIHDDILAVLTLIRLDPGAVSTGDLDRAEERITLLDKEVPETPAEASSITNSIIESVSRWTPDAHVSVQGERNGAVPREAASALMDAAAEALRNSQRHASPGDGRPVSRRAEVVLTPDRIRVIVSDDGVGFDAQSVHADRLGIALSIKDRMATLDGGSARVLSAPGRGTTVELTWQG